MHYSKCLCFSCKDGHNNNCVWSCNGCDLCMLLKSAHRTRCANSDESDEFSMPLSRRISTTVTACLPCLQTAWSIDYNGFWMQQCNSFRVLATSTAICLLCCTTICTGSMLQSVPTTTAESTGAKSYSPATANDVPLFRWIGSRCKIPYHALCRLLSWCRYSYC